MPRDREGAFESQFVGKRQRLLSDVDEIVLSLDAKGMTTGELTVHFVEVQEVPVSEDTVSRILDKAMAEMGEWAHRPLDSVHCAIVIGALMAKARDGQVVPLSSALSSGLPWMDRISMLSG